MEIIISPVNVERRNKLLKGVYSPSISIPELYIYKSREK